MKKYIFAMAALLAAACGEQSSTLKGVDESKALQSYQLVRRDAENETFHIIQGRGNVAAVFNLRYLNIAGYNPEQAYISLECKADNTCVPKRMGMPAFGIDMKVTMDGNVRKIEATDANFRAFADGTQTSMESVVDGKSEVTLTATYTK